MTLVFVNLPVTDLDASKAFFTSLGWSINPAFTDENAACLVISETIYSMLLTREFFSTFTAKPVADAHGSTEVLIALSADSRAEVDRVVDAAVAAGGREHRAPMDQGFMFQRSFEDLDGHIWEILWMDPAHVIPTQ